MNDEIAIPQSDNPQTAGPTMWTPEQFMDSLDERPEEIDPRMAITSQPILMSHDTIIKACDFKDTGTFFRNFFC